MDSALVEFVDSPNHKALKENLAKQMPIIDKFFQNTNNLFMDREKVLFELTFCLCTPQSKAVYCRDAVMRMKMSGLLMKGTKEQILNYMQGVRFNEKKSDYIIKAWSEFDAIYNSIIQLKDNPRSLREWLCENITGYGMKEASHFLRNIGLGKDLAILDVHIMRELNQFGLTQQTTGGMPKKAYIEMEKRFESLAKALNMSIAELDCTIWLTRSGS